jgi:hypothetical protein
MMQEHDIDSSSSQRAEKVVGGAIAFHRRARW